MTTKTNYDIKQKNAGLALAIKHLEDKPKHIEYCLDLHETMVDQALGYLLKYLPHKQAAKYFAQIMKRKDDVAQVILMNEIPLLAMTMVPEKYDDMDIPKEKVDPKKIKIYYDIAKYHALPNTREHLASYVHLLPSDSIMDEFEELLTYKDYNTYDRLLHKIRVVPEEDFPFSIRLKMLDRLIEDIDNPYLHEKAKALKLATIRKTLDDTD